jgi:hypothetical protein
MKTIDTLQRDVLKALGDQLSFGKYASSDPSRKPGSDSILKMKPTTSSSSGPGALPMRDDQLVPVILVQVVWSALANTGGCPTCIFSSLAFPASILLFLGHVYGPIKVPVGTSANTSPLIVLLDSRSDVSSQCGEGCEVGGLPADFSRTPAGSTVQEIGC